MSTPSYQLQTRDLIDDLKAVCASNGMGNDGNEYKIIVQLINSRPEVISASCRIIAPMFERIETAQRENRELTQIRDWLLPLQMDGQVRVA